MGWFSKSKADNKTTAKTEHTTGEYTTAYANQTEACYNMPQNEKGLQLFPYIYQKAEFDISRHDPTEANNLPAQNLKLLIVDLKCAPHFDAQKLQRRKSYGPIIWWMIFWCFPIMTVIASIFNAYNRYIIIGIGFIWAFLLILLPVLDFQLKRGLSKKLKKREDSIHSKLKYWNIKDGKKFKVTIRSGPDCSWLELATRQHDNA